MRLIRDSQQGMILVYELIGPVTDREPPTLVFEWGKSSVRLTRYPEEWRKLRDEELLALRAS